MCLGFTKALEIRYQFSSCLRVLGMRSEHFFLKFQNLNGLRGDPA